MLYLLPWLEMGYAVVNVDYRDGVMAKAPAMVEDARCALRWVVDRTVGSWTVSSTGLGQQSRVS